MSDQELRVWKRNYLFIYAISLHGLWGLMLLFTPAPLGTTALGDYPKSQYLVAVTLLLVASMAALSIVPRFDRGLTRLILILPQQFALMLSAFTALRCSLDGHYADGVARPGLFIFVDQCPALLAMILHTAALIDWMTYSIRKVP